MKPSLQESGLGRLSLEDRITIVEEIWESVTRDTELTLPTEAQRRKLERRLADSIA